MTSDIERAIQSGTEALQKFYKGSSRTTHQQDARLVIEAAIKARTLVTEDECMTRIEESINEYVEGGSRF